MSNWTYEVSWNAKKIHRKKTFNTKDEALLFVIQLRRHGISPWARAYRPVTWSDRIRAFFGFGRIDTTPK